MVEQVGGAALRLTLICPLILAGCTMAETPRSATYYIGGGLIRAATLGDVAKQAQEHCDQYGRDAEYIPSYDNTATFRCVDRVTSVEILEKSE